METLLCSVLAQSMVARADAALQVTAVSTERLAPDFCAADVVATAGPVSADIGTASSM